MMLSSDLVGAIADELALVPDLCLPSGQEANWRKFDYGAPPYARRGLMPANASLAKFLSDDPVKNAKLVIAVAEYGNVSRHLANMPSNCEHQEPLDIDNHPMDPFGSTPAKVPFQVESSESYSFHPENCGRFDPSVKPCWQVVDQGPYHPNFILTLDGDEGNCCKKQPDGTYDCNTNHTITTSSHRLPGKFYDVHSICPNHHQLCGSVIPPNFPDSLRGCYLPAGYRWVQVPISGSSVSSFKVDSTNPRVNDTSSPPITASPTFPTTTTRDTATRPPSNTTTPKMTTSATPKKTTTRPPPATSTARKTTPTTSEKTTPTTSEKTTPTTSEKTTPTTSEKTTPTTSEKTTPTTPKETTSNTPEKTTTTSRKTTPVVPRVNATVNATGLPLATAPRVNATKLPSTTHPHPTAASKKLLRRAAEHRSSNGHLVEAGVLPEGWAPGMRWIQAHKDSEICKAYDLEEAGRLVEYYARETGKCKVVNRMIGGCPKVRISEKDLASTGPPRKFITNKNGVLEFEERPVQKPASGQTPPSVLIPAETGPASDPGIENDAPIDRLEWIRENRYSGPVGKQGSAASGNWGSPAVVAAAVVAAAQGLRG